MMECADTITVVGTDDDNDDDDDGDDNVGTIPCMSGCADDDACLLLF